MEKNVYEFKAGNKNYEFFDGETHYEIYEKENPKNGMVFDEKKNIIPFINTLTDIVEKL